MSETAYVIKQLGTGGRRPSFIDPNDRTGTECIGPEDTFDSDYGRLLERAYGKGVASPTGFDTSRIPLFSVGLGFTGTVKLAGMGRAA